MPARPNLNLRLRFAICSLHFAICGFAAAQPDPSGIEFVTISDPGNVPWMGIGNNDGRGSVGYEFKIGKFEVTTSQWVEFMNAAFDRPAGDSIPRVRAPQVWGATSATPQNAGGRRWAVSDGNEMRGTGGINWRTAAIYCNWLHNGKSSNRDAFLSGAYDVSTFGASGPLFADQQTRSPGAQYWIPSLDEWMKAAHYDPDRYGDGQGGWWENANSSDLRPAYGPPGTFVNGVPAAANSDWNGSTHPGFDPYAVLLGSYAATSPWGLFDTAGMTSEWTEEAFQQPHESLPRGRYYEGSAWSFPTYAADEAAYSAGGEYPTWGFSEFGLRIAAAVPTPTAAVPLLIGSWMCRVRRRGAR